MAATKNNDRIHTRSPFYINAVPTTGTITQADLTIKLQTGTRLEVGAMTDLTTYSLTSTNAVDNVIVFNISPLIDDYLDRTTNNFDVTALTAATANECLYVFWDLSVTRTGGTDDSSGYYVGVEGYSTYDEGVNYAAFIDITADFNYGDPDWIPATAKGVQSTIMATDCYRQISEDSYAVLPIYMGQFDQLNTTSETFARVAFGPQGDAFTFSGSTIDHFDYTIEDSDTRSTGHLNNLLYVPVGKKNMSSNWISGYNHLTVGHCINRDQTDSGTQVQGFFISNSNMEEILPSLEPGEKIRILSLSTSLYDIAVSDSVELSLPAFTGCSTSYSARDVTLRITAINPTNIEFLVDESSAVRQQVNCYIDATSPLPATLSLPIFETSNDIALVNDNPAIRYEIICEPKYSYVDFFFVNKWGAWDCFTFLKANRENIDVKSETHYKSVGTISGDAYTYDKYDNQRSRFNISAKKSYTVNTGYVDESFSLLLEEILVTPRAFMIWDGVRVPVNVKDATQELKQHVNEKLINYTLELEASNNHINTAI